MNGEQETRVTIELNKSNEIQPYGYGRNRGFNLKKVVVRDMWLHPNCIAICAYSKAAKYLDFKDSKCFIAEIPFEQALEIAEAIKFIVEESGWKE